MQFPVARYWEMLAVKAEPLSDPREGLSNFIVISGPDLLSRFSCL